MISDSLWSGNKKGFKENIIADRGETKDKSY